MPRTRPSELQEGRMWVGGSGGFAEFRVKRGSSLMSSASSVKAEVRRRAQREGVGSAGGDLKPEKVGNPSFGE